MATPSLFPVFMKSAHAATDLNLILLSEALNVEIEQEVEVVVVDEVPV